MRSSTLWPSTGPKAQPIETPIRISTLSMWKGSAIAAISRSASVSTMRAALRVLDDDGEFVAAHPADMAERPDLLDQPLGDALQHRVALRVAERVVDRLEAVEIEEHDRAGRLAAGRAGQRLAEQLADAAAIGQAGKHVHIGEVGQPLLGAADVGDVLADAAKALELAGHVDDRIARQADPAGAAPGLQLHLEIGEGLAREQGAAERAGAAQRGGQRMAEQLGGRAAEQGGHPRGDVDDAVLGIDLPQPADAAMLIFVEQQADRFGLGAGRRRAPSAGRRSSGSAARRRTRRRRRRG